MWFQGAPARYSDGCPAAKDCLYDAHRYLTDKRRWLGMVMDGYEQADDEQVLTFLRKSPWGRCVYHCDNDAVDHQVLACELDNGITATHTMTAFDSGRGIEIYGTLASLKGGNPGTQMIMSPVQRLQHGGRVGGGAGDERPTSNVEVKTMIFHLDAERPKGGMPREMRFRRMAEGARSRVAAAAASVMVPRTPISLRVQSVRSFFGRFVVKGGMLSLPRFQATEALLIPVLWATSPSGIFPRRAISFFVQ